MKKKAKKIRWDELVANEYGSPLGRKMAKLKGAMATATNTVSYPMTTPNEKWDKMATKDDLSMDPLERVIAEEVKKLTQ